MGDGGGLFGSSAGIVAGIALVLGLLALAGIVYLLARQQRLTGQYEHLVEGTSRGNLEVVLNDHIAEVRGSTARIQDLDGRTRRLEQEGRFSLKYLGIVRFNPFHDTGSDQSFALALADGLGDGLVISSLHARDVTRVYAKPLQAWESAYSLTDEERRAIALAQDSHPN